MDAQRFDRLTRVLAGRFSRRGALRQASAAASLGWLTAVGVRPVPASAQAAQPGQPLYTAIRHYTLTGAASDIEQALQQGYLTDACKAAGFVAYFTVDTGDGHFATVSVFDTQQHLEAFANNEADWIAQHLSDLPSPDEEVAGQTTVYAGSASVLGATCPAGPAPTAAPAPTTSPGAPTATAAPSATAAAPTPTATPCAGAGCPCTTGTESPCGDGLICCGTTGTPGGPGTCKAQADCSQGCTGQGCACNGGVQGNCDVGLVCCQGGQSIPGGPGTCQPENQCQPAGATPVSS